MRWMLEDVSIHVPVRIDFDDLMHLVTCQFAGVKKRHNIAKNYKPINHETCVAA